MSALESVPVGLIADIGGTNARFALCRPGQEAYEEHSLPCASFPGPVEAAESYLMSVRPDKPPTVGVFAIASPITGDSVTMTNHPWRFSIKGIRQALGLRYLDVINDFAAVALCVPHLLPGHRLQVGGGTSMTNAPIGVLGAGTGLGVALLVPDGSHWRVVPTEGGHATMPAADDHESAVLAVLRRRFGHVSAERILSGPGLVNLYFALAEVTGQTPETVGPTTVTERGLMGTDPLCFATVQMFLAMLGTVAGNLVLTIGGRGGLYIAGGIVPRLAAVLPTSLFRARFESKGRFRDYNMYIPTYVITHSYPAFLGLSAFLHHNHRQQQA
ncbi:Glucokinase [invertebrate metagenome]|uniref:Glucokinase n=1 Tax=invertebrate metagenome TaxID=1711999 RepID=A0A484H5K4_9ZZZZ